MTQREWYVRVRGVHYRGLRRSRRGWWWWVELVELGDVQHLGSRRTWGEAMALAQAEADRVVLASMAARW